MFLNNITLQLETEGHFVTHLLQYLFIKLSPNLKTPHQQMHTIVLGINEEKINHMIASITQKCIPYVL